MPCVGTEKNQFLGRNSKQWSLLINFISFKMCENINIICLLDFKNMKMHVFRQCLTVWFWLTWQLMTNLAFDLMEFHLHLLSEC